MSCKIIFTATCLLLAQVTTSTLIIEATAKALRTGRSGRFLRGVYPPDLNDTPFASIEIIKSSVQGKSAAALTDLTSRACAAWASSHVQGRLDMRNPGVELWETSFRLGRAAYLYPEIVPAWSAIISTCSQKGGQTSVGMGYAFVQTYIYSMRSAEGLTNLLAASVKKGGCKALGNVLDVAAAVAKARHTGLDSLHEAVNSYPNGPVVAACVPRDDQVSFRPTASQRVPAPKWSTEP